MQHVTQEQMSRRNVVNGNGLSASGAGCGGGVLVGAVVFMMVVGVSSAQHFRFIETWRSEVARIIGSGMLCVAGVVSSSSVRGERCSIGSPGKEPKMWNSFAN